MYTSTLGLATFMDRQRGRRTGTAIMWFGLGALLGWPFAGALILPFVAEDWFEVAMEGGVYETSIGYLDGIGRCLMILGLQVGIDASFYRKLTVVPWRIVAYNVFGGKDRGPDIFGTEPWHYYVRNLLLNFNLWFLLAMVAAPLAVLQTALRPRPTTKQGGLRTLTLVAPFYLWVAIFTLQPHKEERFMFPAYPFLALNAAIALHILMSWFGISDPSTNFGIPLKFRLAIVFPVVALSFNVGLLRILGTVINYRAPLQIYDRLNDISTTASDTVCFGKDWYRFPTSFLLPDGMHAKFIKDDFDGLLPGEFSENRELGMFPGTWAIPSGMNDRNEEDVDKYTDIRDCSFLIESFPHSTTPEDSWHSSRWEVVECKPFLDTAATGLLARLIWMPDVKLLPPKYRKVWGKHCLLRARKS